MKYVRLGRTGLEVSRICLGCMSYGDPNRGTHPWSLPEEQSRPILRAAWEAGINFFDTANVYSLGSSEEIVGKILKELAPREDGRLGDHQHFRGSRNTSLLDDEPEHFQAFERQLRFHGPSISSQ